MGQVKGFCIRLGRNLSRLESSGMMKQYFQSLHESVNLHQPLVGQFEEQVMVSEE